MNIVPFKLRQPVADALPYDMQYRIVHGYRRAFVHVGQGTPLLLIHGIGDSSDTWRHVIPELARDHRVVAPDLLGHGRSDKPRADYSVAAYANAMRDLLSVLDIERVTVVGHSLGGGVAMQFAYQYPERCERLVLVATGGVSHEVHPALRLAATPMADLFLPLIRLAPVRLAGVGSVRLMEILRTDLGRDAEHLLRMFESLPDATARRAFVRTIRAVVDWRGQAITMLDRCYLTRGMPTLLMWGAHDAVIPMHHGEIAHKAMPGSRLETFPDAGHFPHYAEPARFAAVLRDFVATTAPASYTVEQWRALLRRGRPSTLPAPDAAEPRALGAPLAVS
ncbi:MAG TPA: alpha/beta hydrolase [Polyangiaceae bacterium]|nr:alpha/beta hydrolase [Polyangiaceae bacterium]